MEHSQNPYQTPRADVAATKSHGGITAVMAETLGKGAFWARLLSVVNFIALGSAVLGLIAILFMSHSGAGMITNIISTAISILIYWFYGISMHRYAGAAKRLRNEADEDDAAMCFASFATFIKVTGVLLIIYLVIAVIGIGAALVLPAMMH